MDQALAQLQAAVDLGYQWPGELTSSEELKVLRKEAQWERIVTRAKANYQTFLQRINRDLYRLYLEDQSDRDVFPDASTAAGRRRFGEIRAADTRRRGEVDRILAAGGARISEDYFHAGLVFQHGELPSDYRRAHELAVKAVELDPANDEARWLAAASTDRELLRQHLPQRYGTHYKFRDGREDLFRVDPSTTDEERKRWNIMPLARNYALIARYNRQRETQGKQTAPARPR